MTTRRLGSQAPKMSRKPKTFSGFAMPESNSPQPKTNPHARLARRTMSAAQHVPEKTHDEHRRCHEYRGGRDRAGREARDAAHAVAGGAAAAEPGAEADEQSGPDDQRITRRHFRSGEPVTRERAGNRRQDQPGEKRQPPAAIAVAQRETPGKDSAD